MPSGLVRKVVDGGRATRATRQDPASGRDDVDQGDFDPANIEVFVGVDMAKGDHYA
jgi:hypothetical protein